MLFRRSWIRSTTLSLLMLLTSYFPAETKENQIPIPVVTKSAYQPVIGKPGGQLTIASTALPKTFNAYLADETSTTDIIAQMYLGLVTTNPASTKIEPALAESWVLSPDNLTYTFKLRKSLKWSDGQPLTADDVVFTYNNIINNDNIPNNYRDGLLIGDVFPKVAKIDTHTVSFTTPKPFVPFLRGLSDPIMPRHILGKTVQPDSTGQIPFNDTWGLDSNVSKIVCNGPWKIGEYVAGKRIVLVPNPYYYRKDAKGNALPYVQKFMTVEVPEREKALAKFLARETDSLFLAPEDYTTLAPLQKKNNFTIHNLGPATGATFVMFNMSTATNAKGQPVVNPIRSAWFRDKKFRQALAHAVDKNKMIKQIYEGLAIPQTSHISQQTPFYKPQVKAYDYNLATSQKLLSEAGYKKNAKGELLDPKNNRVEFNLVTNAGNVQRDQSCTILHKDWGQLGIKVNYKAIPFNEIVDQIDRNQDWESIMIGLTGSAIEPHFGINTWKLDGRMHMHNMGHPSKWDGKKGTIFELWEKEILALYEKAAVEFNFEKRKALYWETQDIVAENLPVLYTVNQFSLVAVHNHLGNIYPTIHGGTGLNQVNWNSDFHFIK